MNASPHRGVVAWRNSQFQEMTAAEPIDLDFFKYEEDIYGCDEIKSEPAREPSVFYPETPTKSGKGKKKSNKGSPYNTPSHKRPAEHADVEDRVLVTLVDSNMEWR
jgi:hypothetical protein